MERRLKFGQELPRTTEKSVAENIATIIGLEYYISNSQNNGIDEYPNKALIFHPDCEKLVGSDGQIPEIYACIKVSRQYHRFKGEEWLPTDQYYIDVQIPSGLQENFVKELGKLVLNNPVASSSAKIRCRNSRLCALNTPKYRLSTH